MSCFVIIRGPAGVGKTTVAKLLAQMLDAYYVSCDEILAKHGLTFISGECCVPEYKMLAANNILIPLAQEKLIAGQPVIFDGNFYHKAQIEDLIMQLKVPYSIYTLKASLNLCLARNRVRVDPLTDQEVKNVFELVFQFDYGNVIDTAKQSANEIACMIKQLLQEAI